MGCRGQGVLLVPAVLCIIAVHMSGREVWSMVNALSMSIGTIITSGCS